MSENNGYNGNSLVKDDSVQQNFTAEEVREYAMCMNNISYFCENYVKVISLDDGLAPFKLRGYQEDLVDHYEKNRFSVVKACRQSGKSITSVAYLLHYLVFNSDKKVAILANKGSTAREMLARLTLMLEHLPFFLQPGCKTLNKGNIVFSNNSEVIAAATSSSSIRGLAIHVLMLDEFAFVNDADEFYTSTYPVISSGKDTKVIITSTPNGIGNMFYKIWEGSQQNANEFKPFSIGWRDVPGRDDEWRKQTISNTSEAQFKQEFECDFLGSSQTLIDANILLGLTSGNPIKQQHDIKFYKEPTDGHEYVLCADVSKGRGQDYSTFSVIDVSSSPFQQVATYRENTVSPLLFPDFIIRAAKIYNNALVVIENNDVGQVVCNSVYYDHEYDNTFTTSSVKSNGIGVTMSTKVKRIGCSNLKDLLEDNQILIVDPDTILELSSFAPKGKSYAATQGNHDDSVMNFVLFSWFVSTDVFQSMSNTELRELLYKEKLMQMEEDLPPFGFMDNGLGGNSNYHDQLVEDAKSWSNLGS